MFPGTTAVYVITAGDATKIGISKCPALRVSAIQCGQAHEVRVYWAVRVASKRARRVEAAAHKLLDGYRMRGEWFAASPETACAAIKAVIKRLGEASWPDLQYGRLEAPTGTPELVDWYEAARRRLAIA